VGELITQTLNFAPAAIFQIEHNDVGPMPDNVATNLIVGVGEVNGTNVLRKIFRQKLSSFSVGLAEDYTQWLHKPPLVRCIWAADDQKSADERKRNALLGLPCDTRTAGVHFHTLTIGYVTRIETWVFISRKPLARNGKKF
jgi:hypothetical protein